MKNKSWFTMTAMAVACCLCCGCYELKIGVEGSGVSATDERTVDEFWRVELSGAGDINISCGESQSVTVTIDDNLQELITTEVFEGTLEIGNKESYNSKIGLTVDITVPELKGVEASGACDTSISNCQTDELDLEISGAGKLRASGQVDRVVVELSGAGKLDLSQLRARQADVELSGAAKATVNASEGLDVEISGVGSVSYYGDPQLKESISGLGKVTRLGDAPADKMESEDMQDSPLDEDNEDAATAETSDGESPE